MALGVGKVVGPYYEIPKTKLPPDDQWSGQFRRQYPVEWTFGEHSLREILKIYRPTVRELSSEQEQAILKLYGI
jgi:hypothetical protein